MTVHQQIDAGILPGHTVGENLALDLLGSRARAAVPSALMQEVLLGDRYRLAEPLGSGGMGKVYRAIDLRTGGSVAVKLVHPHLAADPEYAVRLRREATLLPR